MHQSTLFEFVWGNVLIRAYLATNSSDFREICASVIFECCLGGMHLAATGKDCIRGSCAKIEVLGSLMP